MANIEFHERDGYVLLWLAVSERPNCASLFASSKKSKKIPFCRPARKKIDLSLGKGGEFASPEPTTGESFMSQVSSYPCATPGCTNTVMRGPGEAYKTLCHPCLWKKFKDEKAALEQEAVTLTQRNNELADRLCNALEEVNKLSTCSKTQADAAIDAYMQVADAIFVIQNTTAAEGMSEELVDVLIKIKDSMRKAIQAD